MENGEILELIICGWKPIYESDMEEHKQKIPILTKMGPYQAFFKTLLILDIIQALCY